MKDAAIAGVNPARIVDATRKEQLAAIICEILPADEPRLPAAANPPFSRRRTRAHARHQRAGRPGRHARHAAGGRSRNLGAAARVRAVPPARDRHGGLRQDATRRAGDEGRGRARAAAACTCVSTGRSRTTFAGSRRPKRRWRTTTSCATGLRATRAARRTSARRTCSPRSKSSSPSMPIDASMAIRRVDRRRRPGFPRGLGGRARAPAEARRRVVVAGRPDAESVYARARAAARLDHAARDHQLPQPARHSRLHARRGGVGAGRRAARRGQSVRRLRQSALDLRERPSRRR